MFRKRFSTTYPEERGQSLVEFTVVLPILCLLLFGIIQFGITFNNYISLTDAVRAGARKAAVSRNTFDPVGATKSAVIASGGDISIVSADVTVTSDWQPGHDVQVQATHPYSINVMGLVIASGLLKSQTIERVE
jgi:Flp pilus assembly protein TadG